MPRSKTLVAFSDAACQLQITKTSVVTYTSPEEAIKQRVFHFRVIGNTIPLTRLAVELLESQPWQLTLRISPLRAPL